MNGNARIEAHAGGDVSRWISLVAKALLPVGLFAVSMTSATVHRAQVTPTVSVAEPAPRNEPAGAAPTNVHSHVEQQS